MHSIVQTIVPHQLAVDIVLSSINSVTDLSDPVPSCWLALHAHVGTTARECFRVLVPLWLVGDHNSVRILAAILFIRLPNVSVVANSSV